MHSSGPNATVSGSKCFRSVIVLLSIRPPVLTPMPWHVCPSGCSPDSCWTRERYLHALYEVPQVLRHRAHQLQVGRVRHRTPSRPFFSSLCPNTLTCTRSKRSRTLTAFICRLSHTCVMSIQTATMAPESLCLGDKAKPILCSFHPAEGHETLVLNG